MTRTYLIAKIAGQSGTIRVRMSSPQQAERVRQELVRHPYMLLGNSLVPSMACGLVAILVVVEEEHLLQVRTSHEVYFAVCATEDKAKAYKVQLMESGGVVFDRAGDMFELDPKGIKEITIYRHE